MSVDSSKFTNPATDVMLAELATFEAAIWRSEETGEKRFNFYITLVTAVAGGLVALWSADPLPDRIEDRLPEITASASFLVLIFGCLTFMRLKQRDKVTAQLKRTTDFIRQRYRASHAGLQGFDLPCPMDPEKTRAQESADAKDSSLRARVNRRVKKFTKGGYTISIAVMNGGVLAVALISTCHWASYATPTAAGALLAIIMCVNGSANYPVDYDPNLAKPSP